MFTLGFEKTAVDYKKYLGAMLKSKNALERSNKGFGKSLHRLLTEEKVRPVVEKHLDMRNRAFVDFIGKKKAV